jgi:hypothetical protein
MLAPGRTLRSLAAGLLYLAGVLAFLEASSRVALRDDVLFSRLASEDDSSNRLRFIHSRGRKAHVGYFFDEYHPTRGWALKPGLRDLTVFGDKRLSSNSRGVRGAAEHGLEREAGRTRIVVLGDSFTFGEEVSDAETWAARLQALAPETEVLNLGVHGYGHDQMLVYLREEGIRYKPDVVLLGFVHVDMARNLLDFRDYAKPRFQLKEGRLELRSSPVPIPETLIAGEQWRSKLLDLLLMFRSRFEERSGATERRARVITAALLDEIALVSASGGAKPVFAYLPVEEELDGADRAPTDGQRFFADYCGTRHVACLDLRPAFRERVAAGTTLKARGHWGPLEHGIGAAALRDGLERQGLLPPTSP